MFRHKIVNMKQNTSYYPLLKNAKRLLNNFAQKPQGTLEFQLIKSKETFSSKPSIKLGLDSNLMVALTCLELYNSIFDNFDIIEENKIFEHYIDLVDEFFFHRIER